MSDSSISTRFILTIDNETTMNRKSIAKRKEPNQPRAQLTVASILQAMEELVSDKGYVYASTNRIAERAGVSIGTLYHYFPNREAIALSLYEETCSTAALTMKKMMVDTIDLPIEEAIPTIMQAILEIHQQHSAVLLQLVDEVPELRVLSYTLSFNTLLRGSIKIFLQQHSLTITIENIERTRFFLENIIMGNIRSFITEQPEHTNKENFIAELTGVLISYLKP